jgi:PKD repeat protein
MKKNIPLLLCLLALSAYNLSAQCDTLSNLGPHDTLTVLQADSFGFIAGSNDYSTEYVAEEFAAPAQNKLVTGALVAFGYCNINSADSDLGIPITVFNADPTDTLPGIALTTQYITLRQVAAGATAYSNHTGLTYTAVTFATPAGITGDKFYIGVGIPQTGDEIAVLTNTLTGTDGHGYLQAGWGGWYSYQLLVYQGTTANNYGIGNAISPITCAPSGPVPVAGFTANPLAGCAGIGVRFQDNSTGVPTIWHWDFGNGDTSNLPNPIYAYVTPGTYTVTLTVTNLNGANSVTQTNYINALPAPVLNLTIQPDTTWNSGNGSLITNVTGGTPPYNYVWSNGSTASSIYNVNFNTTYGLTVTDILGCSSQSAGVMQERELPCYGSPQLNCGSDTLVPFMPVPAPGTGYVTGNNSYGVKTIANRISVAVGAQVSYYSPVFSVVKFNTADTGQRLHTYLWDATGPGGTPGHVLYADSSYTYGNLLQIDSNFDTINGIVYTFSEPYFFPVTDTITYTPITIPTYSFYVGFDLPTTPGDTLVIATTTPYACYDDSNQAYSQSASGQWTSCISQYFQPDWGMNEYWGMTVCPGPGVPASMFSYSSEASCGGGAIQFFDQSTNNPTAWWWTFDLPEGTVHSTQQNPVLITSASDSSFNAFLLAFNAAGCSNYTYVFTITSLSYPYTPNLCIVTTDTALTQNTVVWEKPNQQTVDSYYVYRANGPNYTCYQQIAAVNVDSLSAFVDSVANPEMGSYRYKLSDKNTCGGFSQLSPYHQTMFLQYADQGVFNITPYAIEEGYVPFASYGFYRDTTGTGNWQLLQSLTPDQTTVTDPSYAQYFPNASYELIAELPSPCTPQRSITEIQSNIVGRSQLLNVDNIVSPAATYQLVPNPMHTQFDVVELTGNASLKNIRMFDAVGREIFPPYSIAATGHLRVDMTGYASGAYLVQIITGTQTVTLKAMKM